MAGLSPGGCSLLPRLHLALVSSFLKKLIYLFIFGCIGSSLLHVGFL